VLDGTIDVFAVAPPGKSAVLNLYPSASNFTTSLPVTQLYSSTAGAAVANGAILTIGPFDVTNFASLDFVIQAYMTNQSTSGAAYTSLMEVIFYDSTSGGTNPVFIESWWFWLANGSTANIPMFGSMPCHGNQVTINIYNPSTGSSCIEELQQFTVFGSPRVVPYSDFRQNSPGTAISSSAGTVIANGPGLYTGGTDDIIGQLQSFSAAASNSYVMPLALYAGPVSAHFIDTVTLTVSALLVSAANMLNNGELSGSTLGQGVIASSGLPVANTFTQMGTNFPRAPVFLYVSQPATAGSFAFSAVGQQAA
jgi:hypothetical protein